ncbi:hypothetical protein BZA77DRAFT_290682 [Pyronema omphalodes]|nr:hypothetical protein BZA77DRAFT_290682 [Pyronema omphalodes]
MSSQKVVDPLYKSSYNYATNTDGSITVTINLTLTITVPARTKHLTPEYVASTCAIRMATDIIGYANENVAPSVQAAMTEKLAQSARMEGVNSNKATTRLPPAASAQPGASDNKHSTGPIPVPEAKPVEQPYRLERFTLLLQDEPEEFDWDSYVPPPITPFVEDLNKDDPERNSGATYSGHTTPNSIDTSEEGSPNARVAWLAPVPPPRRSSLGACPACPPGPQTAEQMVMQEVAAKVIAKDKHEREKMQESMKKIPRAQPGRQSLQIMEWFSAKWKRISEAVREKERIRKEKEKKKRGEVTFY